MRPVEERLLEKVQPEPMSGCWLWLGAANRAGYGNICVGSKTDGTRRSVAVHRLVFTMFVGPIPEGLEVLHKCDTPRCVNPEHLFVGTQKDNLRDMLAKGRGRPWNRFKTHCKRGHPLADAPLAKDGSRFCRPCHRMLARRHYHRAKGRAA